jgi:hypothetical protein
MANNILDSELLKISAISAIRVVDTFSKNNNMGLVGLQA